MKVTPLDIRRKEFKRSMRGYADEEVDIFLDEVADEFERVFQENAELRDRLERQEEQLQSHAQIKSALEKTLVSAQLQADQMTANARKEAELVMRDAELQSRKIVAESYAETQRVQQALVQLKHLEEDFRYKFQSLLEAHLKLLNEAAPLAIPEAPTSGAVAAETEGIGAQSNPAEPETSMEPGVEPAVERALETPVAEGMEPPEEARTGPETQTVPPPSEPELPLETEDVAAWSALDGLERSDDSAAQRLNIEEPPAFAWAEPDEDRVRWAEVTDEVQATPVGGDHSVEADDQLQATSAESPSEDGSNDDIPTQETEPPEHENADAFSELDELEDRSDQGPRISEGSWSLPEPDEDEVSGFFYGKQIEDMDNSSASEAQQEDKKRDFDW